jgi:hypothetical protein
MTITSSGPKCDVCGHFILPIDPEERVNTFSVKYIEKDLHCHNACKEKVLAAGKDWTLLPEGPLRKAFEEANANMKGDEDANCC